VSGTVGIWIVMGVIVGFIAYREAGSFARHNGRTPWDIPAWGWALLAGGLGLLVGGILLVIARRTTKPVSAPYGTVAPAAGPVWAPPTSPEHAPTPASAGRTVWYPPND
jgi:hypothetical protein